MKKLTLSIEFILVLGLFILYPFTVSTIHYLNWLNDPTVEHVVPIDMNYSLEILVEMVLATALYIQFKLTFFKEIEKKKGLFYSILAIGKVLLLLGLLFLINVFVSIVSLFVDDFDTVQKIILPENNFYWMWFFAGTFGAAFFEEMMFRVYIPECLRYFFGKKGFAAAELIALFLFMSGHLYLGITGMLNAFLAGIVLRYFYLKNKSVWINTIAHGIYNLILYLFSVILLYV